MSLEKVRLGDVTDSCLGKMLDQNKNRGDYQPYLANLNVRWGSFELDNLSQMRFLDTEEERYGVKYGDLIICEGGEPGRCAIWKEQIPNMKIQKALHRVRVHDCLDYRYLYYWFLLAGYQGALVQYFTGATIKHMPGDKLKSIVIDMPPLEIQTKIADILSAYDSLIENNQKQIKLLEEAAQRLYKEWFVNLRFPGYETTPVVEGIPEGWMSIPLGECISYEIGGGWGEETPTGKCDKEGFVIRGTDFYGITHGDYKVPFRYHSASNLNSRVLSDGDIIFEVSGGSKTEGVARTAYITQKMIDRWKKPVMCASFCKLIRSKDEFSSLYLFNHLQYLRACGKTTEYDKKSASSIVNYRWKDFLSQEYILIPPSDVLTAYNSLAKPLQESIVNCSLEIEKASIVRDSLLPKLMSGEIEV